MGFWSWMRTKLNVPDLPNLPVVPEYPEVAVDRIVGAYEHAMRSVESAQKDQVAQFREVLKAQTEAAAEAQKAILHQNSRLVDGILLIAGRLAPYEMTGSAPDKSAEYLAQQAALQASQQAMEDQLAEEARRMQEARDAMMAEAIQSGTLGPDL